MSDRMGLSFDQLSNEIEHRIHVGTKCKKLSGPSVAFSWLSVGHGPRIEMVRPSAARGKTLGEEGWEGVQSPN